MPTQNQTPLSDTIDPPPSVAAFVGGIPACYDRDLGPLLFEFSAADLARRLDRVLDGPARVLEVACGTGIATEHLWHVLREGSELVATDLNPAMLEYASAHRGGLGNVRFQQADALELPFEDGSFDAVVCQFGLMFFEDKARGLSEMTRVLRPGGHLILNVWDSLAENSVVELAHETIGGFFQDDPPRFLEVPFGDHDVDTVEALLRGAGLQSIAGSKVPAIVSRPAESVARGLVEGNPGVLELRRRGASSEAIVEAVRDAIERAFGSAEPTMGLQAIAFEAAKSGARSLSAVGVQ